MHELIVIDVGGTTIKFGVFHHGKLFKFGSVPTPAKLADFYEILTKKVKTLQQKYPIQGVALSVPGAVNKKTGVIEGVSAVPYIHDFAIKAEFEKRFGLPVSLENDANCAALAEAKSGAGKDQQSLAVLVIGTGVGGAFVLNKKIWHGAHLAGGEFGYLLATEELTLSMAASPVSMAKRYFEKTGSKVTGKEVFALAKQGDVDAKKEVELCISSLAKAIYELQYSLDPELFVLGGAIANNPDLIPLLEQKLTQLLAKVQIAKVRPRLALCTYREDANLLGAAFDFEQTNRGE